MNNVNSNLVRGISTITGKWIYGQLHETENSTYIIVKKPTVYSKNAVTTEKFEYIKVNPNTVSKCTDYKMKDGILLFEKDILTYQNQHYYTVKFIDCAFCLIHKGNTIPLYDILNNGFGLSLLDMLEYAGDETNNPELVSTL